MSEMIEFLKGYEDYFGDWVWEMAIASLVTMELMLLSFILACALGLVIALMRISQFSVLSGLTKGYIGFFRGVPVLVILYWIYFAMPELGYKVLLISSFTAAVLGLGIHGSAFLAEVFRSGIEALDQGQMEAALSLGMTPSRALRFIILPHAARVVLPPMADYSVELMLRAKDVSSSSFLPMHAFVLAAVFYYIMSFPMMRLVEHLEAKMAVGQ